ncbi:MAG TPA: hypothetical protein CFH81_01470 [Sulfurovum sp. UBA12169]|nr:MAG TPA: hypothetical protein CFH81_01470 [Sulfurovum sp. UBA12169]
MKKYFKYIALAGAFSSAAFLGGCATDDYGYPNGYGYNDYGYYNDPYRSSVLAVYSYPYYTDRPYYIYGGRYYYGGYYRDGYYYYRGRKLRGGKFYQHHHRNVRTIDKRPEYQTRSTLGRTYQDQNRYRYINTERERRNIEGTRNYRIQDTKSTLQNRDSYRNVTVKREKERKITQKTFANQEQRRNFGVNNENKYRERNAYQHRVQTQKAEPRVKETYRNRNDNEENQATNPFNRR